MKSYTVPNFGGRKTIFGNEDITEPSTVDEKFFQVLSSIFSKETALWIYFSSLKFRRLFEENFVWEVVVKFNIIFNFDFWWFPLRKFVVGRLIFGFTSSNFILFSSYEFLGFLPSSQHFVLKFGYVHHWVNHRKGGSLVWLS